MSLLDSYKISESPPVAMEFFPGAGGYSEISPAVFSVNLSSLRILNSRGLSLLPLSMWSCVWMKLGVWRIYSRLLRISLASLNDIRMLYVSTILSTLIIGSSVMKCMCLRSSPAEVCTVASISELPTDYRLNWSLVVLLYNSKPSSY